MAYLEDGHPTTISFTSAPSGGVYLRVKEITPPGIDAGGEIDTTTMENSIWRTRSPKSLKTLSEVSFTAQYDPAAYDALVDLVGVNDLITITFPDESTLAFYGWLDKFTPDRHTEGTMPSAACSIIPSNVNADTGAEAAPDYTA